MGLLEIRPPLKRDQSFQRYRSRFARLVLFKKIDYVQLVSAVAVFFFFVYLFQIFFLPGSVTNDLPEFSRIEGIFGKHDGRSGGPQFSFLKELDFGEDVSFEPLKILAKLRKDGEIVGQIASSRNVTRFGYKKPRLALIFADLWVDPHQILMATVATALREIDYDIEIFALEHGPVRAAWREVGLPLNVITADESMKFSVDWLNCNGIIVSSLGAVGVLSRISSNTTPEVALEMPKEFKTKWLWHHFEPFRDAPSRNNSGRFDKSLDDVEKQFNLISKENSPALVTTNQTVLCEIWEEQKNVDMAYMRKRREDDEDRTDQTRGTWDEVYRNARRVERTLHERDEGELERTGQPLCIYEPYYGEGSWPFLHHTSLYRGIRLSKRGRRPAADDVDAATRLSVLNNAYYRDVLGEYGAFFAIANRIDCVHRNAWIGFQSWRATARLKSLSKNAERSLLEAIEARTHGDTLYFWARLDTDPRYRPEQDFWSFCDAINAGNCRFAFSEALKEMYSIKHDLPSLPRMPSHGGSWSVLHSWALPTRPFLEFVMFSRMFVDALHEKFYEENRKTGLCRLSLSEDKQCFSRLLKLLMNVWAYHSARRMVYIDPDTGSMHEQHELTGRRGRMWVKWFQFSTLKSMDEELAEGFDSDRPETRRLWPLTGEVFWRGVYEKERNMRIKAKERKKKLSRDKLKRMRRRSYQKVLGKYVKPVEEESNSTNTTV